MLDYLENKLISIFLRRKNLKACASYEIGIIYTQLKNLHLHELTKLFNEVFRETYG